jgi:DNA-binding NarL/FixJ family response regulator
MNDTDLACVEQQLSVVIRLLSKLVLSSALAPDASQQEKIGVLNSAGLKNQEIAEILGTTPGTVRSAVTRLAQRAK